jgi:hypothetical protein
MFVNINKKKKKQFFFLLVSILHLERLKNRLKKNK